MKSQNQHPGGVPAAAVHHRGTPAGPAVMTKPRRAVAVIVAGSVLSLALVAASVFGLAQAILSVKPTDLSAATGAQHYGDAIKQLGSAVAKLEDDQVKAEATVVPAATLQQRLSAVQLDASFHSPSTSQEIAQLQHDLAGWQKALTAAVAATAATSAAAPSASSSGALNVPIVLYHSTPGDFDRQLTTLADRGYTTITMQQLANALLNHAALPAKPVVLTFDDGLANQMTAFSLLGAHHMRATYYIINDGPIINTPDAATINRPHNVGGWDYLSWDQVRLLDQSGIIEIGSHTMDHLELAKQTVDVQRFEIIEGKIELESQLGHPVTTFAYPYGSYSATTVDLARQAGFTSAVTTVAGTWHTPGTILTLTRIRSVYGLP